MAQFSVITDPDEVARVTALRSKSSGRLNARMVEYNDMLVGLPADEVMEVEPDESETVRGLALRFSRAAKRLHMDDVKTWAVNGILYVGRGVVQESPARPTTKTRKQKVLQVVEQSSL